jgi:molecular chaperone DnaK
MTDVYVGIDLGTTNTTCAVCYKSNGGEIISKDIPIKQLRNYYEGDIPIYEKDTVLPSAVWCLDSNNFFTGSFCKDIGADIIEFSGSSIIRSIKREIGNQFWRLHCDESSYSPVHISSLILKTVYRSILEEHNEEDLKSIAITIPASFSSKMRYATLQAAELVGIDLNKTKLIDEPVASIFSNWNFYSRQFEDIDESGNYLVFDMGGGTLDVSVLNVNLEKKTITVMSTSRYNEVAGDDIDLEIASLVLHKTKSSANYNKFLDILFSTTNRREKRALALGLLEIGELFKIDLSEKLENGLRGSFDWVIEEYSRNNKQLTVSLAEEFGEKCSPDSISLDIKELLTVIAPFIIPSRINKGRNIFVPIRQALEKADTEIQNIKKVMIAGGSTYFPPIIDALNSTFLKKPVRLNPINSVSLGASIMSYFENEEVWLIKETTQDSLFLKRRGHPFLEIFPSSPIPSKKPISLIFNDDNCPYIAKGKREICLEFFQGRSVHDPLMSFAHIEYLELERDLSENGRIVEITGNVDRNKIFHFELTFQDDDGSLKAKVNFKTASNRTVTFESFPSDVKLNGEML